MSQAEIQITDTPPLPGVQLVQELNDAFEALATDFSGSVDPAAYAFAYSLWADTGTGNLKRRNAANNAWVVVGRIFPDAAPAFSAYPNAQQTLSATTYTKILFQTEEFDTNNNYASSAFTPTVAGYYEVNTAINWGTAISRGIVRVYKNGTDFKTLSDFQNSTSNAQGGSCLVYCNGSTDYIEIYAYAGVGCTLSAGSTSTWFQASMVRSAT